MNILLLLMLLRLRLLPSATQVRGIDATGQNSTDLAQRDHALHTHRVLLDDPEGVRLLLRENTFHGTILWGVKREREEMDLINKVINFPPTLRDHSISPSATCVSLPANLGLKRVPDSHRHRIACTAEDPENVAYQTIRTQTLKYGIIEEVQQETVIRSRERRLWNRLIWDTR